MSSSFVVLGSLAKTWRKYAYGSIPFAFAVSITVYRFALTSAPRTVGTLSEVKLAQHYSKKVIAYLPEGEKIDGIDESVEVCTDFSDLKNLIGSHFKGRKTADSAAYPALSRFF